MEIDIAKALEDSTRRKIVELLIEKPMTTSDLAKALGLSKATISHHLKILQDFKLIKVFREEKKGNFIKKFYVSTLSDPSFISEAEKVVLEELKPNKADFLRVLTRSLTVTSIVSGNAFLLKKVGKNIGLRLERFVDDEKVEDSIADLWEKLGMGKVVEATKESFVVEECYSCKGLPDIGKTYCKTDEGILESILEKKFGKRAVVREVKCWGTGYDVCFFEIRYF